MDGVGKADVKIIYKMHTYFLGTERLVQFSWNIPSQNLRNCAYSGHQ